MLIWMFENGKDKQTVQDLDVKLGDNLNDKIDAWKEKEEVESLKRDSVDFHLSIFVLEVFMIISLFVSDLFFKDWKYFTKVNSCDNFFYA